MRTIVLFSTIFMDTIVIDDIRCQVNTKFFFEMIQNIKDIRKRKYQPCDENDKIKQGTHGSVLLCRDDTDKKVALKKIESHEAIEKEIEVHALREIAAYKRMKQHENILSLFEVINENPMFLVLTAMDMTLAEALRVYTDQDESLFFSYKKQLMKGISWCHAEKIMHRDIKPQNILVKNGKLKIGDFGLAKKIEKNRKHSICAVTLWYRPIEILLGDSYYNESIDVWSCACVFYEIDTRKRLFGGDSEVDTLMKIYLCLGNACEENLPNYSSLPNYNSNIKFKKSVNCRKKFPALYLKMLSYNKEERISAYDVYCQLDETMKMEC